jgi:hypothetical protein
VQVDRRSSGAGRTSRVPTTGAQQEHEQDHVSFILKHLEKSLPADPRDRRKVRYRSGLYRGALLCFRWRGRRRMRRSGAIESWSARSVRCQVSSVLRAHANGAVNRGPCMRCRVC